MSEHRRTEDLAGAAQKTTAVPALVRHTKIGWVLLWGSACSYSSKITRFCIKLIILVWTLGNVTLAMGKVTYHARGNTAMEPDGGGRNEVINSKLSHGSS